MTIATGVFKTLAIKKQTALKTIAPAGPSGSAKKQRRVTSTIDLAKASFQSNEKASSQQRQDSRHGVKSVAGTLSQELSAGGQQEQFEAVLRAAGVTLAAYSTATIAMTVGFGASLTDSASQFLAKGFKAGDVVELDGFAAEANNKRYVVTTAAAGALGLLPLDGVPVVAEAAGETVNLSRPGKKIAIPSSGHTRDLFTIEHWHSDIEESEVFVDCVFTGFTANLPPSGMATVEFPVLGLDMQEGQVEYFDDPAPESAGGIFAALNGALLVDGAPVGNITGLSLTLNGNFSTPGGVVGNNVDPDIFPGMIDVSGQATVLFENGNLRDKFIKEQTGTIVAVLTSDNSANPEALAFVASRVKFNGATKDDADQGLTLTVPFVALRNMAGGAATPHEDTTLSIQDTTFA